MGSWPTGRSGAPVLPPRSGVIQMCTSSRPPSRETVRPEPLMQSAWTKLSPVRGSPRGPAGGQLARGAPALDRCGAAVRLRVAQSGERRTDEQRAPPGMRVLHLCDGSESGIETRAAAFGRVSTPAGAGRACVSRWGAIPRLTLRGIRDRDEVPVSDRSRRGGIAADCVIRRVGACVSPWGSSRRLDLRGEPADGRLGGRAPAACKFVACSGKVWAERADSNAAPGVYP